jgi:uncharacterized membrane protein YoaT (DUF817 family)
MPSKNKAFRFLVHFGWQEALSCLFPVVIFAAMAFTKVVDVPYIPRYDFLLLVCLLMQAVMVLTKLETIDELKVICVFHLIGLALELYKVHMGSWSYPDEGWTKLFGVPLYSGFMYASVASYLCQAWRRMDLKLKHWPPFYLSVPLCAAIYANFFTHHYLPDFRWLLTGALLLVFWRTTVSYTVDKRIYRMPMVLSFALIGLFIWIAENISTLLGAWTYPDQQKAWTLVHLSKISSWFLLIVIIVIIVAQLKHVKASSKTRPTPIS